jgi:hypothetical protein
MWLAVPFLAVTAGEWANQLAQFAENGATPQWAGSGMIRCRDELAVPLSDGIRTVAETAARCGGGGPRGDAKDVSDGARYVHV